VRLRVADRAHHLEMGAHRQDIAEALHRRQKVQSRYPQIASNPTSAASFAASGL
jgi:hypothetical protein